MKLVLIILTSSFLFFTSCNKNGQDGRSKFSKDIDLSIDPCNYISKEMIVCHFGGSSSNLELIDDSNPNKISSACGYMWKKSDQDEIQVHRSKILLASASKGANVESERISDFNQFNSPNNRVKIGSFTSYDDDKSAIRDFKYAQIASTQREHKIENSNGSNILEINGVGDQAFYNRVNKSLNVRFGTISFSVIVDTEFDTETNILIAKKLANEVWNKL